MEKDNPPFKDALAEEAKRFELFYCWLSDHMPKAFFQDIPGEWTALITHNLMNFKAQNYFSEIHLKNAVIVLCIDHQTSPTKILDSHMKSGIKDYISYVSKEPLPFSELQNAFLRVVVIHFTDNFSAADQQSTIICALDPDFKQQVPELIAKAKLQDAPSYITQQKNSNEFNVLLAWKNVPKSRFFSHLIELLSAYGFDLKQALTQSSGAFPAENITLISLTIETQGKELSSATQELFFQDLAALKFSSVSRSIFNTFGRSNKVSKADLELIGCLHYFIHQVLVHADEHLYSLQSVEEGLTRHPELTMQLMAAFAAKLDPKKRNKSIYEELKTEFYRQLSALDTGTESHDLRRKTILKTGMEFVDAVLKTNFYQKGKTASSFRLDPIYLEKAPFDRKKIFPELPFGIFFIKGLHFIGFHVRFRDLARGGLRTVLAGKKEKIQAELPTVFAECYNLAYTQNKKNKDIPEGGAKGICFLLDSDWIEEEIAIIRSELTRMGVLETAISEQVKIYREQLHLEFLYASQRSYILSLLSIINCHPDGSLKDASIVDELKAPEYIYLGPDENMHDTMIEWIAKTSRQVGYKPGGAFISGKPALGINHKEYGVTSLGVHVYTEALLRYLQIDPRKSFTVKMTGGPDGDVAGNEMLNLDHYCRNSAKLLAITDVSGTIFDPVGLDLETCSHLFHEKQSIRFYPADKLSPGGFLLDRQTQKEENDHTYTLCWKNSDGKLEKTWLSTNETNSLFRHNVHQTKADLFIPCGGRPRTLRESNYEEFLDENGIPTSKAIVEGANLYLTQPARRLLEERGTLIIKDSSANKGGVICSSFEILAGLALTEEEFLIHKEALVKEILERIRLCAQQEADLLLSTHAREKRFLTDISEEISERINLFTDQLLKHLETVTLSKDPKDPLIAVFLSYCPAILRTQFQARLLSEIPDNHKKAIIACFIAARLVYQRGLHWMPSIVDILPLILKELA